VRRANLFRVYSSHRGDSSFRAFRALKQMRPHWVTVKVAIASSDGIIDALDAIYVPQILCRFEQRGTGPDNHYGGDPRVERPTTGLPPFCRQKPSRRPILTLAGHYDVRPRYAHSYLPLTVRNALSRAAPAATHSSMTVPEQDTTSSGS
jgi:hypothetical protein